MVELIIKKRSGEALTKEEYTSIIDGFISGEIPDYQISAFLMAIYFQEQPSHGVYLQWGKTLQIMPMRYPHKLIYIHPL